MTLDNDNCLFLLRKLPCFYEVPTAVLTQLAACFHLVVYPARQQIVVEHELIDSVLVVVEGNAEVSQQSGSGNQQLLAVLTSGDAIGLDDTQFFSRSNQRTATVTALTVVTAYRLALPDFERFLQAHSTVLLLMQKALRHILIATFIKKLEPFEAISPAVLHTLATHITTQYVPANTILFQQGDVAECCYLLCTGKVDVSLALADGSHKKLATINPGELLGEVSLLIQAKRNATVKTILPCELLVIKRDVLQTLTHAIPNAATVLTSLLMDRHRPMQCERITQHARADAEGNTIIILKNSATNNYVKISAEGVFIWERMTGEQTLLEIAEAYFYQYHQVAVELIGQFVLHLMQAGFAQAPSLAGYVPQPTTSRWLRCLIGLRRLMQCEYAVSDVDNWVTTVYQRGGYWFYTRLAKGLMAVITLLGVIFFVLGLPQAGGLLQHMQHPVALWAGVIAMNYLVVPLHELAHALTTKAYGYQVHRFGVGWFWLGPIAFADTSDMWLSPRKPRMVVTIAGIYLNCVIAGAMSVIAWWSGATSLGLFCWLVALSNYLMAFYNLDPLFELDGYYLLMDGLDTPNLRMRATAWLFEEAKKTLRQPALVRQYRAEICYWLVSLLFIISAAGVAYLLQVYVVMHLLPSPITQVTSHMPWLFSAIVLALSFLSLYAKLKQQRQQQRSIPSC